MVKFQYLPSWYWVHFDPPIRPGHFVRQYRNFNAGTGFAYRRELEGYGHIGGIGTSTNNSTETVWNFGTGFF